MNDQRDGTLIDYARLIQTNRLLIIALTVLCTGAAAALSLTQPKTYQATAKLSFQEESQSSAVAGVAIPQTQTAAELAAQGADTVLRDDVVAAAQQQLGSKESVTALKGMLTTSVDTASNLVTVSATGEDPKFASNLANAVARTAADNQTDAERQTYSDTADRVQRQLKDLQKKNPAQAATVSLAYSERIASLRTLALNAQPAKVARPATVPDSPESPKPIRDTGIGLVLGLLLAIVIAFLRASFDRRMRDTSDIEAEMDMPILGVIRREALGRAAWASPNGHGPMEEQDLEAFRILRTNLAFLGPGEEVNLTVVTSALPEEGKSTVAASLAMAEAAAGRRTVLLECDLRRPCLAGRLSIDSGPGLGDLLLDRATREEIVQHVAVEAAGGEASDVEEALDVIVAGRNIPRPAELLASKQMRALLRSLADTYELVILDTPPLLSVADTLELLPHVDGVLVCVRADQTTRNQVHAAMSVLHRLPDRPTAAVVTGIRRGRDSDYGYYSSTYIAAD